MQRPHFIFGLAVGLLLTACGSGADTTPEAATPAEATTTPTIVPTPIPTFAGHTQGLMATLQADDRFHTLVELIEAAAFADTLEHEGAFTFFAPSDAAFEALPAGSVEDMLKPENAQATADLLRYHLVPEVLSAKALVERESADTALPEHRLIFRGRGEETLVNNIRILIGDIQATNGVIHMIEYVLQPAP